MIYQTYIKTILNILSTNNLLLGCEILKIVLWSSVKELSIHIYRSNTTDEDLGEYTKTTNPDEINIDDDFDTDEEEEIEGTVANFSFSGFIRQIYIDSIFI